MNLEIKLINGKFNQEEVKLKPTKVDRGKTGNLQGSNEEEVGKQEKLQAKLKSPVYPSPTSGTFANNNNYKIL